MKSYIGKIASVCLILTFGATAMAQEGDVKAWMKSAHFIVGVYNVEDLIQIPGTQWIIGGGLTTLGPGMNDQVTKKNYLHIFDAKAEAGQQVKGEEIAIRTDLASYPETTTPPDWETFSPHGIGLGKRDGDIVTLYTVNHGPREAVEVFQIDVSGDRPRFTWIGSVLAPKDGFIDAVAWVPGTDGFVVTSLLDPRDPEGEAAKQMKGEASGWVREWHPNRGWTALPGSESLSAPNGVIVSEDGRYVFVAASANMSVARVPRSSTESEVVSAKVAGIPDNVRWSADGKSILVGVHTEEPEKFMVKMLEAARSGGNLDTTWNITRIDPESMKTEIVMPSGVYGELGGATGAIEVSKRLWISSAKSDRIGIFDLHP